MFGRSMRRQRGEALNSVGVIERGNGSVMVRVETSRDGWKQDVTYSTSCAKN